MNILVVGGTRFFRKQLVWELLGQGHTVAVATRGKTPDPFGGRVTRIALDRTDSRSVRDALGGADYDLVYDNIAYASNDVRRLLDTVRTDRYILTSSTAVYDKKINTVETDFDPLAQPVSWGERAGFSYAEGKRQAEGALFQAYGRIPALAVRFPFVIGDDDYTLRLLFYIEHAVSGAPLYVDNEFSQMSFISRDEAARFLAFLADRDCTGGVNAASKGTIALNEVFGFVYEKTGKRPILRDSGEAAPYNGEPSYSINTDKAKRLGFAFSNVREYLFPLVEKHLEDAFRTHDRLSGEGYSPVS